MKNFESTNNSQNFTPPAPTKTKEKEMGHKVNMLALLKDKDESNTEITPANQNTTELDKKYEIQNKYNEVINVYDETSDRNAAYNTSEVDEQERDIWRKQLEELVIKPEQFPKRILRAVIGTVREYESLSKENAEKLRNIIIFDTIQKQREALDTWVDFFVTDNKEFSTQFKEFVYRSLPTFGKYNEEKKAFAKRKNPSDPYPKYNKEALEDTYKLFNTIHTVQEDLGKNQLKENTKQQLKKVTTKKLKHIIKLNQSKWPFGDILGTNFLDYSKEEKTEMAKMVINEFTQKLSEKGFLKKLAEKGKELTEDTVLEQLQIVEQGDFKRCYAEMLLCNNDKEIHSEKERIKYWGKYKKKNFLEEIPERNIEEDTKENVAEKPRESKLDHFNYDTKATNYNHRIDHEEILDRQIEEHIRWREKEERKREAEGRRKIAEEQQFLEDIRLTVFYDLAITLEENGINCDDIIDRFEKEIHQ